jgi:outer membrane protein assembly factor BamD (BamD/ComL family)
MIQNGAVSRRLVIFLAVAMPGVLFLGSCGSGDDGPVLVSNTAAAMVKAEELNGKAKAADDAGKTRRAIRLYDRLATEYPFAPSAEQARYRQAELLDREGRVLDAFKAYDQFLTRYPGSARHSAVLLRQTNMAQSAAEGDVRSGFLGLKTKLSLEKTVEMLNKLVAQAPRSRTASKARFTIGELYQSRKKTKEAIAAYRDLVKEQPDSPEAPEALFRIGSLLLEQAERGNQNQANLDLAREAFEDYLLQYPGHSKNGDARGLIKSLQGRDLERSFGIAEFYLKTGKHEAAKVYYRDIVRRGGPGEYAGKSRARLKELGE